MAIFGRYGDKKADFFFFFFLSSHNMFTYLISSLILRAFSRKIALKVAGPLNTGYPVGWNMVKNFRPPFFFLKKIQTPYLFLKTFQTPIFVCEHISDLHILLGKYFSPPTSHPTVYPVLKKTNPLYCQFSSFYFFLIFLFFSDFFIFFWFFSNFLFYFYFPFYFFIFLICS